MTIPLICSNNFFELVEIFWHIIPRSYFVDGKLAQCTPYHLLPKKIFRIYKTVSLFRRELLEAERGSGENEIGKDFGRWRWNSPFLAPGIVSPWAKLKCSRSSLQAYFFKKYGKLWFLLAVFLFDQRWKPFVTYIRWQRRLRVKVFKNVDNK